MKWPKEECAYHGEWIIIVDENMKSKSINVNQNFQSKFSV